MPQSPRAKLFRAFRHRNYRLFFFGQVVSLIGSWMSNMAMSWLAYRLTDSAIMLGMVSFASMAPTFFLSPLGGVLVDRFDRRKIFLVTQILSMGQSFLLGGLTLSGAITPYSLLTLALVQGVVSAADWPARQALVFDIVTAKEDRSNAVALNASIFHGARLVGPSIGGFIVGFYGEGVCFIFDGVSFLAALSALSLIRLPVIKSVSQKKIIHDLWEGFSYTVATLPIRSLLLFFAGIVFAAFPQETLLPVFAKEILSGGPEVLGMLMGVSGIGAVIASLYLASREHTEYIRGQMLVGSVSLGILLIAFSFIPILWFSLISLLLIGIVLTFLKVSSHTLVQELVEDRMRGRVMSFYSMAFAGASPLGSLLGGILAHQIGVQWTVALGGVCCFLFTYIFRGFLTNTSLP